jgi:hypothetical protein
MGTTGLQWCPICRTYHRDPGEKTDAGWITKPCPVLKASWNVVDGPK